MNEATTFHIICGMPYKNIDKYKNCWIGFEIYTETEFQAENLKEFKLTNFVQFDTKISFKHRIINDFHLKISLKHKRKAFGYKIISFSPFNDIKFIRDFLIIDKLEIFFIFAHNCKFIYNKPLYMNIKIEENEHAPIFIFKEELNCIWDTKISYVAKFTRGFKTYVVKAVNVHDRLDFQYFVRELTLFLMIDHPCMTEMLIHSCIERMFGFVLEYEENGSLLKCEKNLVVMKCMIDICSVMSYLHAKGIVHRDLKPGNILIDPNLYIKLTDFGTTRSFVDDMTKFVGTAEFMAPEVEGKHYDFSADVYSAGAVACFLFDRKNFGKNIMSIKKGNHVNSLPYETQVVLCAMLDDDPSKRPTFREIFILYYQKSFFTINDPNEFFEARAYSFYETGGDYIHYKKSRENTGLFHCLMFHILHKRVDQIGDMSHLGQLLGDKYMSYIFDWMVLYTGLIALDIGLKKKTDMFERYMDFSVDDYRFYLLPAPRMKTTKYEFDEKLLDDYDIGMKLRKTDPILALEYFMKAYNSGNLDSKYQIGRICALSSDERCFKYLNEFALSGHKKSSYYLATFFVSSKYQQRHALVNYFLSISVNEWLKYDQYEENERKWRSFKQFKDNPMYLKFYLPLSSYKQNLGTDVFKIYRIFPNFNVLVGIFYANVLNDKELADYYFRKGDDIPSYGYQYQIYEGEKKKEAAEKIKKYASKGDTNAQLVYLSTDDPFVDRGVLSNCLSNLITKDMFSADPSIHFQKGLDCLYHLDFEQARYYIDNSASKNFPYAVFVRALLAYHGHCYPKERENSLKQLIDLAYGNYAVAAFEVGIILLQGVYTSRNNVKGIEMMKIAEINGILIPKAIKDEYYNVNIPTLIYEGMIRTQYITNTGQGNGDLFMNIDLKKPICRSPIYQAIVGYFAYERGEFIVAESWLKSSIEQDYYPAEFLYSLVCSKDKSCEHLLCGAKGGHSQSQALLGLYYIYGINHEVKKEDGIYWLEISAFQGNLVALETLAAIYNFGYRNIPIDLNKAKTYYDYLNMNLKADSIEKYDIYNKVLLTKVKEIGIMHGEDLLCFSST